MKISIRSLLKETFGCFLHHWFMTMVCVGVNRFSGVAIALAGLTGCLWAENFISHLQTEYPWAALLYEKSIGNGRLGSTQLIVITVLTYLFSFWVVNVFLLRTNNTIVNKTITLKKLLLTALKLTPKILLLSLIQLLPIIVLAGCGYILYTKFLPLTVINGAMMAFLMVTSLVAMFICLMRLALGPAVIINQQCSGFSALRQSWQLTKGQSYPVLAGMFFPIFLVSSWWNYLFTAVYILHLYQQLTGSPTVKLQQSSRVKDVHR